MIDKEKVKEILDHPIGWVKGKKRPSEGIAHYLTEPCKEALARQICQLEPKLELPKGIICPLKFSHEHGKWVAPDGFIEDGLDICARKACGFLTCHNFGKGFDEYHRLMGDEGRLLTDEEIQNIVDEIRQVDLMPDPRYVGDIIAQAQDAKTAFLIEAGCQARVERIKREIERNWQDVSTFSFGAEWQAFWEKEEVK